MALTAAQPPRALSCPRCRAPLPEFTERPAEETCAACGISFSAIAFSPPPPPRAVVPDAAFADAPRPGLGAGATPCAAHPTHAAVANCSRCGVFVCELCRIPLEGQELCPTCFDRLSREGTLASVETSFFDASGLALALAIFGWITSCFGIVLGPAAIVLAIKGLRQKRAWREEGGRGGPILSIVLGVFVTLFGLAIIALFFVGISEMSKNGGAKKP